MSVRFRFVCATRESPEGFRAKTALGRSVVPYLGAASVELKLFADNRHGLPGLYNQAIRDAETSPAILIFLHDDVHLCDLFWAWHIAAGLQHFDVVGVAGNRRRVPRQPSWCFLDEKFTLDSPEYLSGIVAHGKGFPPANIDCYGPPGRQVKLLDGVLLAVRSETLLSKRIAFDERFDFHFYDLDFCRQAEAAQLRLGTWPLSVIHESVGTLGTPEWRAAYAVYLQKWQS